MADEIIASQRNAYRNNLLMHGDGPKATFQNNRETQFLRFRLLLNEIAPHVTEGTTLHDLGSGLADLYAYLKEVGLDKPITYSGTEIVDEMVAISLKKYPDVVISNRDIRLAPPDERYDFCVASGTFNLLGGASEEEWRQFCYDLIEKMFAMSTKGIAFNVLTTYRTFSDSTLCYFDPRELFDFLTTRLSRFVMCNAASPLYEVTFTVFRAEFVRDLFQESSFRKYFG